MKDLPNAFGKFFQEKINTIRSSINSNENNECFGVEISNYEGPKMNTFNPITQRDLIEILQSSPQKSCPLDAIPTTILLQCLDVLFETILEIINHSLEFGTFPHCYKKALVKQLIKKHDLDQNNLQNYRPVSNLPYLSKILEKVVLKQIRNHLEINNLMDPYQSAYRTGHSTESALLKIVNDLLMNCDNGEISILTLLDQSAAFDLIDHSILLHRLEKSFGISGIALSWIRSYLSNRSQIIDINGVQSEPIPLNIGVPQGSVLGPLLFVLYTSQLNHISRYHSMDYHSYADDNQIYKSSLPSQFLSLKSEVEECYQSIKCWMSKNKLKLNDRKTEILFCCTEARRNDIDEHSYLNLDGHSVLVANKAKNLGVYLDNSLSMEFNINNMIRLMNFELQCISRIKPYISTSSLKQIISAFVLTRLDYCNSLLAGLPDYKLKKLQKVQNHAARLILGRHFSEHSKDMLIELHWLPVKARIDYKIAMFCFSALKCSSSPFYLRQLLHQYQPTRELRSQASLLLEVPKTRLKSYGDRAFARIGPSVWNSLPDDLRFENCLDLFKTKLKTHLFGKYLFGDG